MLIADVSEQGGRQTVGLVREQGGQAEFVATDVTVASDLAGMVTATLSRFGPAMLASDGGGAIVNTATAAVVRVVPNTAALTAFKHVVV